MKKEQQSNDHFVQNNEHTFLHGNKSAFPFLLLLICAFPAKFAKGKIEFKCIVLHSVLRRFRIRLQILSTKPLHNEKSYFKGSEYNLCEILN